MVFTNVNPMDGNKALGDVSVFWSLVKADRTIPKKIQFRYAAVQDVEEGKNVFWVNMLSPVIEVYQKIKVLPLDDFDEKGVLCYKDELTKGSNRNFEISDDQTELNVNMDYMIEIFPELGKQIKLDGTNS